MAKKTKAKKVAKKPAAKAWGYSKATQTGKK